MFDVETLCSEQVDEQPAAFVLPRPGGDTIRNRDDGCSQARSLVFSTSVTPEIVIPLSIALAMS